MIPMEYIHENESVKIVADTDFNNGGYVFIAIHDKKLKQSHPLIVPEAIVIPLELNAITGFVKLLEEIRERHFF